MGVLFEALAAAPTQRDRPQSQDGAKGVIERDQDELMVRRYGRLDFPAEAGLGVPCTLTITIRQAAEAARPGRLG